VTAGAAKGLHSNVTVNLTAAEAVALGVFLTGPEHWTTDAAAQRAIAKLLAAAERAAKPWSERA
jgi:hypothetical protein